MFLSLAPKFPNPRMVAWPRQTGAADRCSFRAAVPLDEQHLLAGERQRPRNRQPDDAPPTTTVSMSAANLSPCTNAPGDALVVSVASGRINAWASPRKRRRRRGCAGAYQKAVRVCKLERANGFEPSTLTLAT